MPLTMGKIRGTLHMRRYVFVLLVTTKFFGKSFVFKNNVAGKGLPKHDPSGLGAGGLEFKSRRPDQLFCFHIIRNTTVHPYFTCEIRRGRRSDFANPLTRRTYLRDEHTKNTS